MNQKLKPYPEYKDSGLLWLGKIPVYWKILPNRALFSERNERNMIKEQLLSVTIKRGVIKQTELLKNSFKKDSSNENKSKYKLVMPGDLAYNKMRMWQGAVGASKYEGIVSPAYIVLNPRKFAYTWYYHFLFRTSAYVRESYRHSYGICDDQLSLRYEDFKKISTPLPPLEEQKTIVNFLKAKSSSIDRFVQNKQRLIELLKEQKQAIINKTVTRGIDPNVRLKPSGVEWIGDIPEHWEVRRLRTIASVRLSGVDKVSVDGEQLVRLCNYVDVYHNDYITDELNFMMGTATSTEIYNCELKAGYVIITKDSESWDDIAVPAYVPNDLNGVVCAYHLALIRPMSAYIEGEYLFWAFYSNQVSNQFRVAANGVTRYGLSQNAIKSAFFPIPPIQEQREIVAYITKKCAEIETAIKRSEREIELIREYRTRLIADVVTGKVDVRGIPVGKIEELEEFEDSDVPEELQEKGQIEEVEEVLDAND